MYDLVTLGEVMVSLTPFPYGRLRFASFFLKSVAGAEFNVAVAVSRLGLRAGFIGRVGADEFGSYVVSVMRGEGIDVSRVRADASSPTGLYFKEIRSPDQVHVYYYRKGSAGSRLTADDVDTAYICSAKALYVSGITSALSETCHAAVKKAVELAAAHGIPVFFDPNYRGKLWSPDQARNAWVEYFSRCNAVMASLEEASLLVGPGSPEETAEKLMQLGPRLVILKAGKRGVWVATPESMVFVQTPREGHVVDPVGAGDAFAGGFIAGTLKGLSPVEAAKLGALLASYAVESVGDTEGIPTADELAQHNAGYADVMR